MDFMFRYASSASPDTSNWDTAALTNMRYVFSRAISANPDVSGWDTSAVVDMYAVFLDNPIANPDTSSWDTSAVTDMARMFQGATSANPDVSGWDTSGVTRMVDMFEAATSFDQDIGSWDVTALVYADRMFNYITLSTANYESLLIGWEAQVLQAGVIFSGMIAADGWFITDGGLCSSDNVSITSFAVNPNTMLEDEVTKVSWQVKNAKNCYAQGGPPGWSGTSISLPAGSLDLGVGEQGCYTLALVCVNDLNTVSEAIKLEVKHSDVIFRDNFEQPCLLP